MAREFDYLQPNEPRWGRLNPVDPSVDTFRQRWAPFSSDPVGDYIEEQQRMPPPRIAPPGTRERYGDPTKVLSMAGGGTPKSDTEQPYAVPKGFKFDEAPPSAVPKGFVFDEPVETAKPVPTKPSPLEGTTLSQDPAEQAREVAAIATSRGTRGRQEGPVTDAISRFLPEVGAGIKAGFNRFLGDAGGKLQEPQNALPAALGGPVAPGIAAMRGGAALSKAISKGGIEPGAEVGATGEMLQGRIAGSTGPVPPRLTTVTDKPAEDAIAQMANMARTGTPEDLAALARMRQLTPAKKQGEVQAQLVQHLGKNEVGEFGAGDFVRRYSELPEASKNILFGQGGSGSLRHHLDSIAEVTERAPTWRGPSTGTMAKAAVGAAAVGGVTGAGAVAAPLAVLGTMIPVKVVAHALTSPALAASVAAWSRAYERVVRSGGNAAIVGFNLATKNLNNNLGTDVDPATVIGGARGKPVE